ncbi:DoxX family protein [Dyadobacter flavalbus]|uniref:DoxX family protein n=1 Tax=Dyadobacter flavalbus TaxID=2579942 RepID=A0A5M8QSR7_9BACT|nr:DoxX family protein [Dyadobacter flavalbus]KAA6438281.1 DoxX family protein [Dyadobacter flavalbus]
MTKQKKSSGTMHYALWTAQVLLAGSLAWGGMMKLFYPAEKLSIMWPWTGEVSAALLNFTGVIDLLAATGLILPALIRIQPKLTPVTACGVIILMVCASTFHILRNESQVIGANVFFAITAAFIAWGRFRKVPVLPK